MHYGTWNPAVAPYVQESESLYLVAAFGVRTAVTYRYVLVDLDSSVSYTSDDRPNAAAWNYWSSTSARSATMQLCSSQSVSQCYTARVLPSANATTRIRAGGSRAVSLRATSLICPGPKSITPKIRLPPAAHPPKMLCSSCGHCSTTACQAPLPCWPHLPHHAQWGRMPAGPVWQPTPTAPTTAAFQGYPRGFCAVK